MNATDIDSGAVSAARQEISQDQVSREDSLLGDDAIAKEAGPTPEVDRVQEAVMTSISPDGQPPQRELRVTEWKWVLVAFAVLIVCAAVLLLTSSMAWPTVAFAVVILLVLVGATIPTLGAGLLRGGEEKRARVSALRQEGHDRASR